MTTLLYVLLGVASVTTLYVLALQAERRGAYAHPGGAELRPARPLPLPPRPRGPVRLDEVPARRDWPAEARATSPEPFGSRMLDVPDGIYALGWPDGRLRKLIVVGERRVRAALWQDEQGETARIHHNVFTERGVPSFWVAEQRTTDHVQHLGPRGLGHAARATTEPFDDTVHRWARELLKPAAT